MKNIFLITTYCLLGLIIFFGCTKHEGKKELDNRKNLIAFLDGPNKVLLVNPEYKDTVLVLLQAEEGEDDSLRMFQWFVRDGEFKIYFDIFETDSPYTYTFFDESLWVDSIRTYYPFYYVKLYINAECGKVHPGFVAACIGTFGRHRAWGNSMRWQVNQWKSCTSGKRICIEKFKRIGRIDYYPDQNCLDTTFIRRAIFRWACGN